MNGEEIEAARFVSRALAVHGELVNLLGKPVRVLAMDVATVRLPKVGSALRRCCRRRRSCPTIQPTPSPPRQLPHERGDQPGASRCRSTRPLSCGRRSEGTAHPCTQEAPARSRCDDHHPRDARASRKQPAYLRGPPTVPRSSRLDHKRAPRAHCRTLRRRIGARPDRHETACSTHHVRILRSDTSHRPTRRPEGALRRSRSPASGGRRRRISSAPCPSTSWRSRSDLWVDSRATPPTIRRRATSSMRSCLRSANSPMPEMSRRRARRPRSGAGIQSSV